MRFPALIAVPAIALALAGCSTQEPAAQPTSSTEVKPLFASDEEALAAAEAAYTNYLQVSDQIARDGGANPERLKGLVSTELYEEQLTGYRDVESKGLRAIGGSYFDEFKLQENSSDFISTYVCLRLAQIQVIDSTGATVTPARSLKPKLSSIFLVD